MAFTFGLERTWALGLGLIVMLGGTAWIRSEDPANQTEPPESATAEPIVAPSIYPSVGEFPAQQAFVPSMVNSDAIPEHVAKDPVFQELSKAFLSTNQASQTVRFSPSGTSDNVWHAIENTLRTARQLEAEESRLKATGELEKARKHREIIDNLRLQGAKLLANEMQITIS